jgi:hypothetical protein
MKKHFLLALFGIATLFSGCSQEENSDPSVSNKTTSFTLAMDDGAITRANTATPSRYIMEVYEGTTSKDAAQAAQVEQAGNTFDVVLKDGQDYTILFWADYGTAQGSGNVFDASKLREVKIASGKVATQASFAGVVQFKVGTDDVSKYTAVTLKHAVAQVNFKQTGTLTATPTKLTVGYPESYSLNVEGNAVTKIDGAVTHELTCNAVTTGTIATDYIIAGDADDATVMNIEATLNGESKKEISNAPFRRNYATNISGAYSDKYSATLTANCEVDWETTDNNAELPTDPDMMQFTIALTNDLGLSYTIPFAASGTTGDYKLVIDWGDASTKTEISAATDLSAANLTHTYAEVKEYQITIYSSQADATKAQTPDFRPGNNRGANNNKLKFKSMDSPILNTGKTDFTACFASCSNLQTIASGLFDKNTTVTNFSNSFTGCSKLQSIPSGLFDKHTAVTNFATCFANCLVLESIPAGLFDNSPLATLFRACFSNCQKLQSIPSGLFDNNTAATVFGSCFSGCLVLESIPSGLFDNNTLVTDFSICFSGCTSLKSIPSGLFDNNTIATNFTSCFYNCTPLKSIPSGLFEKNTAATKFASCFNSCVNVVLTPNVFCIETDETKANRFKDKTMDFTECFAKVSGADGTAPALWEYAMSASSTTTECFRGATNLTNLASIPTAWK